MTPSCRFVTHTKQMYCRYWYACDETTDHDSTLIFERDETTTTTAKTTTTDPSPSVGGGSEGEEITTPAPPAADTFRHEYVEPMCMHDYAFMRACVHDPLIHPLPYVGTLLHPLQSMLTPLHQLQSIRTLSSLYLLASITLTFHVTHVRVHSSPSKKSEPECI